jgi:hypothetical protein
MKESISVKEVFEGEKAWQGVVMENRWEEYSILKMMSPPTKVQSKIALMVKDYPLKVSITQRLRGAAVLDASLLSDLILFIYTAFLVRWVK